MSALDLIKPSVRDQPAYTLAALDAARKLNQNESPYDLPESLKREIAERAVAARWPRYPEFVPRSLLEKLSALYQWPVEGILVGNGSNELIQATLAVTVGPGLSVVAPAPTFSLYRLLTRVNGGEYLPVPMGPQFEYDVGAIIEAARQVNARVVIVNNPNNPTGTALPSDGMARLVTETAGLVVCDEAYQDFGGESAMPELHRSDRVVMLRTFSKALGMAGLRFGVLLARPEVAREIAKAKLPYNVNLFTLAAADVALDHMEVRRELVGRVVATRDRIGPVLAAIPGVTVFPSAANFFLVRFERADPREVFRRLYEEDGILVRDVSAVPGLERCLRISVGTDEDMDAVATALRRLVGAG